MVRQCQLSFSTQRTSCFLHNLRMSTVELWSVLYRRKFKLKTKLESMLSYFGFKRLEPMPGLFCRTDLICSTVCR